MTNAELDEKLVEACSKGYPDLDEIKELIIAGADTNQLNRYRDHIFDDVFLEVLYHFRENPEELPQIVEKVKETISLMVQYGWDVKRFGLSTMAQFTFSTYDSFSFELYRFMLQYDLANDPQDYEEALEGVADEESFQRCCEQDHDLENLFYAICELIEAKKEGKDFTSIAPYYGAVGLTIDKVLYFGEANTLVNTKEAIEYNDDIGFVCGDKLLVLRESVNILFMNDRFTEAPQTDISSLFADTLGRSIKEISFDHKDVIRGTTVYGQAVIIIELDNGRKIKFTHNFGELADRGYQSRFWME